MHKIQTSLLRSEYLNNTESILYIFIDVAMEKKKKSLTEWSLESVLEAVRALSLPIMGYKNLFVPVAV